MEVLRILIKPTGSNEIHFRNEAFNMVLFEGECDCENFKGKILPGGVDTQYYYAEGMGRISARYMLEGVDKEGKPCKIFIQNEGEHEHRFLPTTPKVYTDSEALSWMQDADLIGYMIFEEDKLFVSICTKED